MVNVLDLAVVGSTPDEIGYPKPINPFQQPAPFTAPVGAAGPLGAVAAQAGSSDGSRRRRGPLNDITNTGWPTCVKGVEATTARSSMLTILCGRPCFRHELERAAKPAAARAR